MNGEPSSASQSQAHARFTLQSSWTAAIREHLFQAAGVDSLHRFLEVGSGTGVITAELNQREGARVTGVDLDPEACAFAARLDRRTAFVVAQGEQLPFPKGHFDSALCHFLLLWTPKPELILAEMTRVTAPGGPVLCLAEPDYGGRIDFPAELAQLGVWQAESLATRGADVTIGRKLRGLCIAAGLRGVEAGILGAEWSQSSSGEEEWPTLWNDLEGAKEPGRLIELRNLDARAWSLGNRILYVPTFFAWGRTPSSE